MSKTKTYVEEYGLVKLLKPGNKRPSKYLRVWLAKWIPGKGRHRWQRTFWDKRDVPNWIRRQIDY